MKCSECRNTLKQIENTKGYYWLGKLISVPPIKQIAKICYAIIALLLFWRFKLFVK